MKPERIIGKCSCGEKVIKFTNTSRIAKSGDRYCHPVDEHNTGELFRCMNCSAVISDVFKPDIRITDGVIPESDEKLEYTQPKPTDKFKHCNHHHELDDEHELVNLGGEEFVANRYAIPLLTVLNEIGLATRTHHIKKGEHSFVSILLDDVVIKILDVNERDASRTKYNGKKELLIMFKAK